MLAETYKPMNVQMMCSEMTHISQYVRCDSPMIRHLADAFGDKNVALVFIANYLDWINLLFNIKERMNAMQIDDCAAILYRECLQAAITVTEFHEFINRMKSGYYGELYSSIDTLKICSAFRLYVKDLMPVRRAVCLEDYRIKQKRFYEEQEKHASKPHKPIDEWFL